MAVAVRGGREVIDGVVLHTDQGSEYTARSFRTACTRCGIRQSMGRPGSALDNAVIESWHSTVEFELRLIEQFATKAQARARVAVRPPRGSPKPRRHARHARHARHGPNPPLKDQGAASGGAAGSARLAHSASGPCAAGGPASCHIAGLLSMIPIRLL
jgi:hypothetical protein